MARIAFLENGSINKAPFLTNSLRNLPDEHEHYVGRPSPHYCAPRLTKELGGAAVCKAAPVMPKDSIILVNLCERGDKDIFSVAQHLGACL